MAVPKLPVRSCLIDGEAVTKRTQCDTQTCTVSNRSRANTDAPLERLLAGARSSPNPRERQFDNMRTVADPAPYSRGGLARPTTNIGRSTRTMDPTLTAIGITTFVISRTYAATFRVTF